VVDDEFFLSAEFIRRKILEGASPDAPNFSAVQEHCPPENHSLFATRHSLPFWLKSVSAKTKPAKADQENWRAHLLMRRKFSAVREHCPPEKSFTSR
jgi:hypothetical protein